MNIQQSPSNEGSAPEPSSGNSSPENPLSTKGGFWSWLRDLITARNTDASLKESLEEVMDELNEEDHSLGEEERSIIRNTLTFSGKRVDDVMVPRADIVAVDDEITFEDMMDVFTSASTSRLPIYHESLDEVIAMVHIKDAFKVFANHSKGDIFPPLKSIQRPILFVPPSMKLTDLLTKMQATHIHMALVIDEYGGTDGLLTIEDLVEQVVGDIEDEHDGVMEELLSELPGGKLRADARLPIEELERLLGTDLLEDEQDDDVDTLGGLLFTISGHIPQIGEFIEHKDGLSFEITAADERRIKTVLIHRGVSETIIHDENNVIALVPGKKGMLE